VRFVLHRWLVLCMVGDREVGGGETTNDRPNERADSQTDGRTSTALRFLHVLAGTVSSAPNATAGL
jgi:hypothetical protein